MNQAREMTRPVEQARERVGLEQYYSEAGPDYAAWSAAFNMHFGYFRLGMNLFDREPMLEQMNLEVLDRLRMPPERRTRLADLGCGVGATMRSIAARLPLADLTGITLVPWQIERGEQLTRASALRTEPDDARALEQRDRARALAVRRKTGRTDALLSRDRNEGLNASREGRADAPFRSSSGRRRRRRRSRVR